MQEQGHDTPLADLSDEQLVELYRQGREPAYAQLVERYQIELFHFLMRFVGRRMIAEDLFQEAFLQVHLSIDTFDTSRRFRPWLFTIAANKARDWLRRNSTANARTLSAPLGTADEPGPQVLDLLQSDIDLPDEAAEAEEVRQRVREAIDTMPANLKEVLVLAYFNQFPYKDIAQMLGVPLGTVKSRLHTAVAAFAEAWKKENKP